MNVNNANDELEKGDIDASGHHGGAAACVPLPTVTTVTDEEAMESSDYRSQRMLQVFSSIFAILSDTEQSEKPHETTKIMNYLGICKATSLFYLSTNDMEQMACTLKPISGKRVMSMWEHHVNAASKRTFDLAEVAAVEANL